MFAYILTEEITFKYAFWAPFGKSERWEKKIRKKKEGWIFWVEKKILSKKMSLALACALFKSVFFLCMDIFIL
jgi:hypothetical protein